jgi:hypothetical protein
MTSDDPAGMEKDWRLQAEFEAGADHGALHDLLGRVRGPDVVKELEGQVSDDVVITHDGQQLFAYAADEAKLAAARGAIEQVLRNDGIGVAVRVSHWDDELDQWRQTDPPPSAEQATVQEAADRSDETPETRTLIAKAGKLVRSEFEQSMDNWAAELGLECKIIEHPHLLSTQVAFTVTGPKRKVDEFAKGLNAEGWAFVRGEARLSPI